LFDLIFGIISFASDEAIQLNDLLEVDFIGGVMLIDPRNFSYRREVDLDRHPSELPALEQEFIVANKLGIHARVAAQIVKVASQFESEILISKCGITVNGKSILDLMTLVCPLGCRVCVSAKGSDAAEALSALASLFQTKFGEL
jgi:phosphocarrier protein